MSAKYYVRGAILAVLLVSLAAAGMVRSYRSGYAKGLQASGHVKILKEQERREIYQAMEASEIMAVLRLAIKALNGAAKHPECFSEGDIAWFKFLVKGNSDNNTEQKLIAQIRKQEAMGRKDRPQDFTKEDEEKQVETARRVMQEARELLKRFPI